MAQADRTDTFQLQDAELDRILVTFKDFPPTQKSIDTIIDVLKTNNFNVTQAVASNGQIRVMLLNRLIYVGRPA